MSEAPAGSATTGGGIGVAVDTATGADVGCERWRCQP